MTYEEAEIALRDVLEELNVKNENQPPPGWDYLDWDKATKTLLAHVKESEEL